jgi:hypothetical protein
VAAINSKPTTTTDLTPSDARALDDLAALDAKIAADEEAQHAAAVVAAEVQALVAHAIAVGDVAAMEGIRSQLNVASFDEAMAVARRRAAAR